LSRSRILLLQKRRRSKTQPRRSVDWYNRSQTKKVNKDQNSNMRDPTVSRRRGGDLIRAAVEAEPADIAKLNDILCELSESGIFTEPQAATIFSLICDNNLQIMKAFRRCVRGRLRDLV